MPLTRPTLKHPQSLSLSFASSGIAGAGAGSSQLLRTLTPRSPLASGGASEAARDLFFAERGADAQQRAGEVERRLLQLEAVLLQLRAGQEAGLARLEAALERHTEALLCRGKPLLDECPGEGLASMDKRALAGVSTDLEAAECRSVRFCSDAPTALKPDPTASVEEVPVGERSYGLDKWRVASGSNLSSENEFMDWRRSEGPKRSSWEAFKEAVWNRMPRLSTMVSELERLAVHLEHIQYKEPEGYNECSRFYFRHLSRPFDLLCMLLILLNIIFMVDNINSTVGDPDGVDNGTFLIIDWSFTVFYMIEVIFRMVMQREYYFVGPHRRWHAFDCVLVFSSLVASSGVSFLRAFRVLRAAKVLRAARFVRFYKILRSGALEVMINCLAGSINMLIWCVVMVLFFTFLFSVFFVQAIADHLEYMKELDVDVGPSTREGFSEWFGSVQKGMLSLLMVSTGGVDWSDVFHALQPAGFLASTGFILYVLLFTIAVWNVVTSTFVDKALKLAKASDDTIITEARIQDRLDAKELRATFQRMDLDGSGRLDFEEFDKCMKRPEFERWLQTRNLDIKETRTFFRMLAGRRRAVDIDTIVSACMRMRGPATSIDLHTMRYELRRVERSIPRVDPAPATSPAASVALSPCVGSASTTAMLSRAGLKRARAGPARQHAEVSIDL